MRKHTWRTCCSGVAAAASSLLLPVWRNMRGGETKRYSLCAVSTAYNWLVLPQNDSLLRVNVPVHAPASTPSIPPRALP